MSIIEENLTLTGGNIIRCHLRRSKVIRIFPNPRSCVRLFSALLKEWHEDWVSGQRYLNMDRLREWEAERPPMKGKELTVA